MLASDCICVSLFTTTLLTQTRLWRTAGGADTVSSSFGAQLSPYSSHGLHLRLQTVAAITNFFLAMTCFPDIQMKAQAEIDAVIGQDRLPSIADKDRLPYLHAIMLEILRWMPVAPLGQAGSLLLCLSSNIYDSRLSSPAHRG